jgi:hypothetical protein
VGAGRTRRGGGNKADKDHATPPSSSMSFSDAIKKAKVAAATAETENGRDSVGQWARATASQPHKTRHDNEKGSDARAAAERRAEQEDDDDDDEEVELCIPGSFNFEDQDSGAARAGTVDPFDAVGRFGNLLRRMQAR